jgi:hypothetical protein
MMRTSPHELALEAIALDARRDRAILAMENAALCRQVRALGHEPISKSSDEWFKMYECCSQVVQAAHELVIFLGTGKEMLADWS